MKALDDNAVRHLYRAQLIKTVRKKLGVSQSMFAEKLGVDPNIVNKWETLGEEPSDTIVKFVELISASEIEAEETPKPTKRVQLRKDRLNTEDTVADYLGISKRTLARLSGGDHSSGRKIKHIQLMNQIRRYEYDAVMDFINEGRCN